MTNLRSLCERVFYKPESRYFFVINDFLAFVTLVSIAGIVLETVSGLKKYEYLFMLIERISVLFFSLEYIGRLLGNKKPFKYIFSFFGLIDLLSIVPTYLHLTNLTALKSARIVRILRFLRIIRLAKVARARIEQHHHKTAKDLAIINIEIYVFGLFSIVLILGTLMHAIEHAHAGFATIPQSMLWVLESVLGGSISSHVPESSLGITFGIIARFLGLIMLGFLIHIVGTSLNKLLLGTKTTHEKKGI